MTDVEIKELIAVLEGLRVEKHPDIPASLIEKLVNAEFAAQDDRTKARQDAQRIIDDFLKTVTV